MSKKDWKNLNNEIISCKKCSRLVSFREKIAKKKTKRFNEWNYWGKPVTGFGDIKAQLVIVGLAPAAHGGNRTGRVFTGDKSADFLINCLYHAKLSNQPMSTAKDDGLELFNSYMTPVLKCVPPEDKPKSKELLSCFYFFEREIKMLTKAKIILALGKIAFDGCIKFFKHINYLEKKAKLKFVHGSYYKINKDITLYCSYHPSPRNVNTKRINYNMMLLLLKKIKKKLIN